jgi:hypothetical protein
MLNLVKLKFNQMGKISNTRRENGKITKEYRAWKAMKARCYSPCNSLIGNYKKNNITVCDRWINSFDNFLEDMGKIPDNKSSLDRINNLLDYSPENCRWTDWTTQANNKESNLIFIYNNEAHTLKQWSKLLNIKYTTLYHRIITYNLTFEEAIQNDPFNKLIEYKGEKRTLKDWCLILELPYQLMVGRRYEGWSIEECFETPKN